LCLILDARALDQLQARKLILGKGHASGNDPTA
jgi:hypothetical protein